MPAHQASSAIGSALKSTGTPITAIDWRANHLVDGLAKLAATEGATSSEEAELVKSADHLVRHCAGQLAAATHAANNHAESYIGPKGAARTRNRRDSQEVPRAGARRLKPLAALEKSKPDGSQDPGCESNEVSTGEQHQPRREDLRSAKAVVNKRE